MRNQNSPATKTMEIRLARRSPAYWRVTFDHPPLNIFGPEGILQMTEIMTALETDERVKVVVFDSAVEGFFLNHSDFLGTQGTSAYDVVAGGKPATAFLFKLISQLQFSGTVPMIDVQAYSQWLAK